MHGILIQKYDLYCGLKRRELKYKSYFYYLFSKYVLYSNLVKYRLSQGRTWVVHAVGNPCMQPAGSMRTIVRPQK